MRYWKFLAVAFVALAVGMAPAETGVARSPYDPQELRLLDLINGHRQAHDLKPLFLSDDVSVAAERHSRDMGKHGFFSHTSVRSDHYPDGVQPWKRMSAEGYDYDTYKSENLFAGFASARGAFRAWRESPGHNANMLGGKYRVVGVARVRVPGSPHGWYWTTDFGGYVDPSAHCGSVSGDCGGLEGGSMNLGRVWHRESADGAGLITRNGWARLGGYNNGRDELSQKIYVKENARITYRLRVATEERRHPYDLMEVRLLNTDGKPVEALAGHTDAEAGDWRRESVDLSRYAGRTLRLSFLARTDEAKPTTFYVDEVRREVRE